MSEDSKPWPGGVIRDWWSLRIAAENGAARKARAQLRRASGPAAVLALEAVHGLNTLLHEQNSDWGLRNKPETLALIAATLAGIETSEKATLPRKFGTQSNERRALSALRFQRIIRADDAWVLAVLLRRALPQVKATCNVASLGNDLFYWGDMYRGDEVRNRWCFEYFGAKSPAPSENSETAETTQTEDA